MWGTAGPHHEQSEGCVFWRASGLPPSTHLYPLCMFVDHPIFRTSKSITGGLLGAVATNTTALSVQ